MNWKSLLGMLKYAPIAMKAAEQIRNRYTMPPSPSPENDNKDITNILTKLVRVNEELTDQLSKQKERITDLEQDFLTLKLLVWIGGGSISVLTMILLIVSLVALGHR